MVLIRNIPKPWGRGLDACSEDIHGPWCSYYHKAKAERHELFERIRASQQTGTTRRPICRAECHTFLCDWKYHEPPPSPHSPALVVYKNPSRGFNSSYHVAAGVASQDSVSEAVAEELEAVNAIYGSGTLQILASNHRKTRLRCELPIVEHAVYWLELATDYPQSMPTVQQAELDLHRTRNRRLQNIFLVIFSTLQTVFKPGHVCIFDTLDTALPIISCLDGHRLEMDEAYYLAPNIIPEEWRWTHADYIDMSNIAQMVECVICMEDAHAFKTVQAPCKHHFCFDCFQTGWEVARDNAEPFTCCLLRLSLHIVKACTNMTETEETNYKRLIKEKDTPNPFFCGNVYCGQLIGSFNKFDLNRGRVKRSGILCSQCKKRTCVKCRERFHPGSCVPDSAFAEILKSGNIRRCPLCGEAIERNGGCRHMRCPTCGSEWWWTKEGSLEEYELHRHRLHLGAEQEALVNRELELDDDEEIPVMDTRDVEAVLMRLDVF